MNKIILVVGARPNIIKAAPLFYALKKREFSVPTLAHTGQHYDYEMSQSFFTDLELPDPSFNLGVGSGSHAEQTGKIMMKFERILEVEKPTLVIVFGDVNSTIACCLTAKKMLIPVAHVEAGLRSFDRTMPEEINRKLTDSISDLLFTHCFDANDNLKNEGIRYIKSWEYLKSLSKKQIETPVAVNVGNIMIDSLIEVLDKIDTSFERKTLVKFKLSSSLSSNRTSTYGLVTLHRPSNVDSEEKLAKILEKLNHISKRIKLVFPVHPRTQKKMDQIQSHFHLNGSLSLTKPLTYKEFIVLEKNALFVITDSGGIQEETSYLDIPCFTLRPNTERPVTITHGTNKLVTLNDLENEIMSMIENDRKKTKNKIPLWDGKTAERIADILTLYFG